MFLLRGHITNSAMITLGVVDNYKLSYDCLELIKTHIILIPKPAVFNGVFAIDLQGKSKKMQSFQALTALRDPDCSEDVTPVSAPRQ